MCSTESDAYGSIVSVLRAQGPFTNDKQKLLQELAKVLHISNERHRSEVRRVVNDDMLATIAEQYVFINLKLMKKKCVYIIYIKLWKLKNSL